jgi:glucose-6-phosphate dehydrogenase assembly protein OpcA
VTLAQVESALTDLRRSERRAAVRTSVVTLVVVTSDADTTDEILDVVRSLGTRHPSRAVVLDAGDPEGHGIDAAAAVHITERDGHLVCFEDVVLRVRGRARWHLDSVVEPLSLPELPVVVWHPSSVPSLGDPLLAVADRVLVDSRFLPGEEDLLRQIHSASRRRPIIDLSWVRLTAWRSLLASLFDGEHGRFARGAQRAEVRGHFAPRHLLGGWLLRSLNLDASSVRLEEADHASVAIEAVADGRVGRFAIEREGDTRVLNALVEVADEHARKQTLHMRDQSRAQVLADALSRTGRDDAYERALNGAMERLDARS